MTDRTIVFDSDFDFRTDCGSGDPDQTSAKFRAYHRYFWGKPLPSGEQFTLLEEPGGYLSHRSGLGEFYLASDGAITSYVQRQGIAIKSVVDQVSVEEREEFLHLAYTMRNGIVFPGNKIDGKMTINGARGFHRWVDDRFDITLECIRLFYDDPGQYSPLRTVLDRYSGFFALFGDFAGYVEFFLLQDMVSEDRGSVRFLLDFDGFGSPPPAPRTVEEYRRYRRNALEALAARNERMVAWAAANPANRSPHYV